MLNILTLSSPQPTRKTGAECNMDDGDTIFMLWSGAWCTSQQFYTEKITKQEYEEYKKNEITLARPA